MSQYQLQKSISQLYVQNQIQNRPHVFFSDSGTPLHMHSTDSGSTSMGASKEKTREQELEGEFYRVGH
jgi:hypothetical protein